MELGTIEREAFGAGGGGGTGLGCWGNLDFLYWTQCIQLVYPVLCHGNPFLGTAGNVDRIGIVYRIRWRP